MPWQSMIEMLNGLDCPIIEPELDCPNLELVRTAFNPARNRSYWVETVTGRFINMDMLNCNRFGLLFCWTGLKLFRKTGLDIQKIYKLTIIFCQTNLKFKKN